MTIVAQIVRNSTTLPDPDATPQEWARDGFHVFPCKRDDKTPLTHNGYKAATTDARTIDQWAATYPRCNWASWPGASGHVVIDADPADFNEHGPSMLERLRAHGTATVATPTGGAHFWYCLPAGLSLGNVRGSLPKGFDVRSDGGYVLIPPSSVVYSDAAKAQRKGVPVGHTGAYTTTRTGPILELPADILALILAAPATTAPAMSAPEPATTTADDAALLDRLTAQSARFHTLYTVGDAGADHSVADYELCCLLAEAGAGPGQIDRLFRGSRLMRDKWDSPRGASTYGAGTIERAIAQVRAKGVHVATTPHVNGARTHDAAGSTGDGESESARYMRALARLGYTFAENELDDSIEVNGQLLSDGLAAQIRCQMRDAGYKRVPAFEDAYRADAYRNKYHPVRRWLDAQTWDGRDRFAELAQYVATEQAAIDGESPVTVWVRYWLVNAVGKCHAPRQNVVLVLDGGQGVGKSTFVRWICPRPEWHKEGFLDPHDRELSRTLATKLVWEVNELGATMRKADQDALKAILTQEAVTFRAPYARNAITRRTTCSFMGTINNVAGFLGDVSGDRRFVALPIAHIDFAYSQALPVAQLWAQAARYWRAGLYTERTAAMRDAQRTGNEEYRTGDPYAAQIAAICTLTGDTGDTVSALDLLHRLAAAGLRESSPRATEMTIGAACKALGLERKRPQLNGVRQVVYTGARFKA